MDRSRRRVLALTSSLTVPALAGCFGIGGGNSGDNSSSDSDGTPDSSADSGEETETPAATETPTATPEPESEFVATTRGIMDQIRWFGVEYPAAKRQFLLELGRLTQTIASLEDQNTLTKSDVTKLRDRTTAFAAFNQAVMAPHFELDDRLVVGDNFLVRNFQAAVEREDTAGQEEALGRLGVFYERLGNESYMSLNLSAHPIHDPLHSMLIAGSSKMMFGISYPEGDSFRTQTFSTEYQDLEKLRAGNFEEVVRPHAHTFDSGQTVFNHAHPHTERHDIHDHGYPEDSDKESEPPGGRVYALSENGVDILRDTELWRDRMADYEPEFTNIFDAVIAREGRVDYAYLTAKELVTDELSEKQFTARPILVQRYEDADAAAAAAETLFETTLREEGTTTLAEREWRQISYDYDGPNLYANLITAGEFLITAAVSPEPHERRDEQWVTSYKGSWLGMEESTSGDGEGDGEDDADG